MKFSLLFIGFIYLTSYEADAYPSGAPEGTCKSMTPKHKIDPETTSAPYKLSVISQNGRFEVSIKKSLSDPFKGFFLQARERDNPDMIVDGEFSLPSNAKFVKCNDVEKNALTHDSNVEKDEITTVWTPKNGYNGNIIFRATVVKTTKEFWINIDSDPVEVLQPQIDNAHSSTDVTTKNPTTSGQQSNSMYEKCGKERGCFGMLENCIESQNCLVLLSYFYDPERNVIEFEISTKIGSSSDIWIAAGISEDKSMGSDSVGDCIFTNGKPSFHYSWNQGKSNTIMDKIPEIVVLSTSVNDGILSCKWTRQLKTVEKGMTFDLMTNEYYLLLAKGSLAKTSPIEKDHHDNAIPSSNRVNFTSISIITGNQNVSPLVKAHGMMWLFVVGLLFVIC